MIHPTMDWGPGKVKTFFIFTTLYFKTYDHFRKYLFYNIFLR